MKIAIGSDHAAFPLKEAVRKHLIESGHDVVDKGTYSLDRVDYPVSARRSPKRWFPAKWNAGW